MYLWSDVAIMSVVMAVQDELYNLQLYNCLQQCNLGCMQKPSCQQSMSP